MPAVLVGEPTAELAVFSPEVALSAGKPG